MGAVEAVSLLIEDHGDKGSGFRQEFADDKPYRSLLQRQGKTLEELLQLFDWQEDDAIWSSEYDKKPSDIDKLIKFRRRVCFDVTGWRDLYEDFGRGDVACLGDIRTPLVTSRSPLKAMMDDFSGD